MKLCLKCLSLWNSNAEYCGKCRRSLGKRCPKGHTNPFVSPAVTCITCNEGPLDGVPYLRLSGLSPLLSLVVLMFAFQYMWDHHCQVLHLLIHITLLGLAFMFDTTPERIVAGGRGIVNLWCLCMVLSLFLPKAIGMRVRYALCCQLPIKILQMLKIAGKVVWRLIKRQATGTKPKPLQTKSRLNDADHA